MTRTLAILAAFAAFGFTIRFCHVGWTGGVDAAAGMAQQRGLVSATTLLGAGGPQHFQEE